MESIHNEDQLYVNEWERSVTLVVQYPKEGKHREEKINCSRGHWRTFCRVNDE